MLSQQTINIVKSTAPIYHKLLTWGIPPAQAHFEFFGPRQELMKDA